MGPSYDMHRMNIEELSAHHTKHEPLWTIPPIKTTFGVSGLIVALLVVAVAI